jgi:hypothetical protein
MLRADSEEIKTTRPQPFSPSLAATHGKTHARHHIGLPVIFPGRIVGGIKILRPVNPGVIDQDIGIRCRA